MIHDVVTEMRRRYSFYETTGLVQAPLRMDYPAKPAHIEGYAGTITGHTGWCDRCGVLIEGKAVWREQFKQQICDKCAKDLNIPDIEVNAMVVPVPALRERF